MAQASRISDLMKLAGLVGLGLITGLVAYKATSMNLLMVLLGGSFFLLLTMAGVLRPEVMFLALVAVSILSPIDFAVKVGAMPRMGPTRAMMLAFMAAWLFRMVIYARPWEKGRLPSWPLIWLILLYLATGFFASAFSVAKSTSIMAVVGREMMEQFVMFYLCIYFLEDPDFGRRLLKTLFLVTAGVCLFAIFEEATHINPLLDYFPVHEEEKVFFRAGLLRVRATFFHPIALGCYVLLVFPLVLARYLTATPEQGRSYLLALLGLLGLTMLFTVSRAPWVFMAFEIGIFIIWKTWKNVYRLFLLLALGAICIVAAVLAYQLNQKVHDLFEPIVAEKPGEGTPAAYRALLAQTVWAKMKTKHGVYGYGPNAFDLVELKGTYMGEELTLKSPDNHYARMLLEYGLPGTGAFILMLLGASWVCLRSARRLEGEDKALAVGAFAAVTAFSVVNWTASMFTMYPLGMIFWLVTALGWRLPHLLEHDPGP